LSKLYSFIFILLGLSYPAVSQAGELSVAIGEGQSRWYFRDRGELKSDAYRLTYIHKTDYSWSFFDDHVLQMELEAGVHKWRDPWLDNDKYGAVINPMWRYYVPVFGQSVYAGVGIGLSYNNDDQLMDRKLGSRLLFEDRFELGIILAKKHRLSISVNHYSNANLADINHGINYYFVNYAYAIN